MKILEQFKNNLLSKKNRPSRVTIKNYLSDIRKFIFWVEEELNTPFNPKKIELEIINLYKSHLIKNQTSEISIKRYISSLRSFFDFLKTANLIPDTPFNQIIKKEKLIKDPYLLNDFKISLIKNKLSKTTIKNYLMDIRQFLQWLEEVNPPNNNSDIKTTILQKVDSLIINEYRNRIYQEANFSPSSVNRKLSSLRNYFNWIGRKDIRINKLSTNNLQVNKSDKKLYENKFNNTQDKKTEKLLENVREKEYLNKPIKVKANQSLIYKILDPLFISPIVILIEKIEFFTWKVNGRHIFNKPKKNIDKIIPPLASRSVIKNIKRDQIKNIPKSIYAPLKISIRNLPLHKKIFFHLRYTRPSWYKKYHALSFSTYLHIGILVVFTILYGSMIYDAIWGNSLKQRPVLASPAKPPPKTLVFKGKLTDAYNEPIEKQTPLRFGIYNDQTASGSALLWQEIQTVIPDEQGKFAAILGQSSKLSSEIFTNNPSLYIGMSISNSEELLPRQQIATIGYSGNSRKLQGLIPITEKSAGTSNVILALDSAGDLTIGGKASPTFQATGGQFTLSGKTILLNTAENSNSNIILSPDGTGIVDLQKPIQNTSNNVNNFLLSGAVEIDDLLAVFATSSGQSAFTINQNSTGPIISASTSGIAKFSLENDGTGFFAGNLKINGNSLESANNTFHLLNENVANLKIAGDSESITIGSTYGSTRINNTLIASGGLTVSPGRSLIVSGNIASDLIPLYSSTYDLGSKTHHWNNAYIDNIFTNPTATVSGFWQRSGNTLSPLKTSDDLLVGGNSSQSATFQILASGNLAGTASTSGQITFKNSSQINMLNNSSLGFYNSYGGDAGINSSAPSLHISSNGNIGIGTNTPNNKLEINGDLKSSNIKISNQGKITFEDSQGGTLSEIKALDLSSYKSAISFSTRSSNNQLLEKMRLDSSGSLIIGGTTANATLDIRGNSGTTPITLITGNTAHAGLTINNQGEGDLFTASSSGTTKFVINKNGNVGIGDKSPTNTLKVLGSICANSIEGACAGNTAGTIYASNTTLQNADVAENYISDQILEPGDIIMPEGKDNNMAIIKTAASYQNELLGIISSKPGITLNSDAVTDANHPYIYPLALTGRVPVKINSSNGNIKTGDYITSSSVPGVGMKATKPGIIIGKALQDYSNIDPSATEKIMVFVNLSYYDPTKSIGQISEYNPNNNDAQISNLMYRISEDVLGKIKIGFLQVQKTTTDSLQITTDNITIKGKEFSHYIEEVYDKATIQTQQKDTEKNEPSQIQPTLIKPISEITPTSLPSPTSTPSALLAQDTSLETTATSSSNIKLDQLDSSPSSISASLTENPEASSSSEFKISSDSANLSATDSANTKIIDLPSPTSTPSAITDNNGILDLLGKGELLTKDYLNISTLSALLSDIPNLNTEIPRFQEGIISYGPSIMSDLSLSGQLSIGGGLILADNSINTIGSDLRLQNLRQGNLSIMSGLVKIDTNGNVSVKGNATFAKNVSVKGQLQTNLIAPVPNKDLIVQLNESESKDRSAVNQQLTINNSSGSGVLSINSLGELIASGSGTFKKLTSNQFQIIRGAQADTSLVQTIASSSAGTAVIKANETERTIISPFITEDSLIYLTATSNTQGLTPYISRQTPESFTISIPNSINTDIRINWWIIN